MQEDKGVALLKFQRFPRIDDLVYSYLCFLVLSFIVRFEPLVYSAGGLF
jgi:hypothetical protein